MSLFWPFTGGGILLGELLLFDDKSGPLTSQLRSLIMLTICDGRERSGLEYKQLLEKHGFKDVQVKFTQTNSLDAVLAIKPWWKTIVLVLDITNLHSPFLFS
jgi:acetylserotonin N-methyltransferase